MASIVLEDGSSFRQTSLLLPEDVIRGIKQHHINKRVICEKALRIAIEQAEEAIPTGDGSGGEETSPMTRTLDRGDA